MIIDAHIHVGPWDYEYYFSLGNTVQKLSRILDDCGIEAAVVMPSDKKDNYTLLNELKRVKARRFWFFPWFDPRDSGWKRFLEENIDYISGIKIHSSLDRIEGGLTNGIYRPFLEFAQEKGLSVLAHSGRWQRFGSYRFIFEAAQNYRSVNFIIAHLGGDFDMLKVLSPRELKNYNLENVYFDISATKEYWAIELAIKEVGAQKIIFGSDFPVMYPKMMIEAVEALNVSYEDKEKIFSGNILKLLNEGKKI